MRAERKAREDRISRRRSYRFAPYYKKPVAETATRMETDDKSTTSTKPCRCYDCGARGHWSRDCPRKDESNKMSKNFTSVLRNFETKMHVKVDNNLLNICSPVGRLKSKVSEWEEMGANKSIVQLIKVGYKIPFKTEPSSVVLRNNRSALNDKDFVTKELQNLLKKGCVSKVDNIPEVVNPLTVAKSRNGKSRLVRDCRHINPHLHKFKYRYEDALVA